MSSRAFPSNLHVTTTNDMDHSKRYSYTALSTDHIRLCRFVEDGDQLSATLEPFPLDGARPPYKALSYTWNLPQDGALDGGWPLRVGQEELPALPSLRPFVQTLKDKPALRDGSWWWIDSICVNQANLQERGHHVRRMKEIYQNAQEVVAWLGPQSDDSDTALDFVYFLHGLNTARMANDDLRPVLRDIMQGDEYRARWIALRQFFLRKWWSRIWTVQEMVIPANVSFWCGSRELGREVIFASLLMADGCYAPEFRGNIAFFNAFHRRRAWLLNEPIRTSAEPPKLSLIALASYFSNNEATDNRDLIYGLLGLCTEDHSLEVSYSKSVDEIYLHFAQSFINQHQSLDILSFGALFASTSGSSVPSWVPDWRTRCEPMVVPLMASQSSTTIIGNLRPLRETGGDINMIRYSAAKFKAAAYSFKGSQLTTMGYILDVVGDTAISFPTGLIQSSEHLSQGQLADILASVCRSLVLGRGDRYLRYDVPTEFHQDFLHLCRLLVTGDTLVLNEEFHEWFMVTRDLRLHGMRFEDVVWQYHHDRDTPAPTQVLPHQDEYYQDTFYGRFVDVVRRMSMRLMASQNGRVGMVPKAAMKGDLICLLFGCSVPMLLRKAQNGVQYTVVGECYVDGCMDGEAVEQREKAGACETTFHIV